MSVYIHVTDARYFHMILIQINVGTMKKFQAKKDKSFKSEIPYNFIFIDNGHWKCVRQQLVQRPENCPRPAMVL